jgi:uncharacterized protein YbjT (DUF2867 family)
MNLIVSGTGRVGQAVARKLLADGLPVRVGARQPERLAELGALGADIVKVDLTIASTLDPALRGIKRVLATAHAMTGTGTNRSRNVDLIGNRAFIDAAQRAGVERFVFLSALGASAEHPVDFFRYKFATEEYLRQSGIAYTILRPSAFMEIWGELIGKSAMASGKATLFGPGTNPVNFISEHDVIAFCMLALSGETLRDTTLDLGAENLTHAAVAELYGQAAGRQVQLRRIPVPVLRALATLISPFHEGTSRLMRTAVQMATTDQRFDRSALLQAYPRQFVSFEQVAREAADRV